MGQDKGEALDPEQPGGRMKLVPPAISEENQFLMFSFSAA